MLSFYCKNRGNRKKIIKWGNYYFVIKKTLRFLAPPLKSRLYLTRWNSKGFKLGYKKISLQVTSIRYWHSNHLLLFFLRLQSIVSVIVSSTFIWRECSSLSSVSRSTPTTLLFPHYFSQQLSLTTKSLTHGKTWLMQSSVLYKA